jgi:branched-chain amino acid aminotransferase
MGEKGLAIFKLQEHTKRLFDSAKIVKIQPQYSLEELKNAQIELLKRNEFKSNTYIRPLIYLGYGVMGIDFRKAPVKTAIAAWEWGAYLGDDALENGIEIQTSSFARSSVKSTMGKAKACANYLNSQMAKIEALENGFHEALLLDESGFVAEGSGECFFIIRDNVLITPPNSNSLESITQKVVLEIAQKDGIKIERRDITRDEVYISDEAFFTGTAAEITPIKSLDRRVIGDGKRGAMTKKIQDRYFDIVYGRDKNYHKHLTFINEQ